MGEFLRIAISSILTQEHFVGESDFCLANDRTPVRGFRLVRERISRAERRRIYFVVNHRRKKLYRQE